MTNQKKIEQALPINNCAECLYAVKTPYTHHIGCKKIIKDEITRILVTMRSQEIIPVVEGEGVYLPLIEVNPHGKANGWAHYPWRFDPVWVKCRLPLKE